MQFNVLIFIVQGSCDADHSHVLGLNACCSQNTAIKVLVLNCTRTREQTLGMISSFMISSYVRILDILSLITPLMNKKCT
jgi:hypothetical protein